MCFRTFFMFDLGDIETPRIFTASLNFRGKKINASFYPVKCTHVHYKINVICLCVCIG